MGGAPLPTNVPAVITSIVPSFTLSALGNSVISAFTGPITNPVTGNFFSQAPQLYFTVPFPNNQPTLYKFNYYIDSSQRSALGPDYSWVFPLTPNSISKQYVEMSNYYDVRGGSSLNGVQRIADRYGMTLPMITIAGTTGFQFHNMDGFQWSGRSSMANLLMLFRRYARDTQSAVDSGNSSLPALEFLDGYVGDGYEVIPIANNSVAMDNSKPMYQNYNLQLLAVKSISDPQAVTNDNLGGALILARAILTAGFQEYWTTLLGNIGSVFSVS